MNSISLIRVPREIVFEKSASAALDRLIDQKLISMLEWWSIDIALASGDSDQRTDNNSFAPILRPIDSVKLVALENGSLEIFYSEGISITIHDVLFHSEKALSKSYENTAETEEA